MNRSSSGPSRSSPTLESQLAALQRKPNPWRPASVREALGVPAIFSAVSLISNTVGTLSLEAFRDGTLLAPADFPRLIVRPNPFTTPRDFFRDTAYYLATRGEAWWWIAARDVDGAPMSLYPVPPWEITVEINDRNRLRPIIKWADRTIANEDIRQITNLPSDNGSLRGVGPLQLCGAAASVAVESQEWAANFYAGNIPSIIGETDADMSEDEMKALKAQWLEESNNNLPKFVTNGLHLKDFTLDPAKAQLTESRQYSVGEVARMFLMPGVLIEYQMSGSSLTYQNRESIWSDLQQRCLSPNYLEPIEQTMSDLLSRSVAARFNLKQLLRADAKTRMEVHQIAIASGVYGSDTAAREEGYAPGNVDFAPVPFSPPAAVPNLLPPNLQLRSAGGAVRCYKCNKMLAETATPPYRLHCPRCKAVTEDISDLRTFDAMDAVDGMKLAIHSLQQPPVVNVAPAEAPHITVQAAAAPNVQVHTDSFVEAIRDLKAMMERPRTRTIIRNEEGRIVGLEEA